jgi:hypothetical protein
MILFNDATSVDPSLRLYNSRSQEIARLMRADGTLVHSWAYPQDGSWHYAEMLENGNLVAVCKDRMILELDPGSKLVRKHVTNAHHDFARRRNGNTLVVSGRPGMRCAALDPGRELYLDHLEEVTPAGQIVWQWKPEEHIGELQQLSELILPVHGAFADWPHINTVEILPPNPLTQRDERFAAGNLLMCGRHIDVIWIVEPVTGAIVWAWGPGELLGPHMPTMLPNGHLLIYDNGNNVSRRIRGYTRVIELEPVSGQIVWQYDCRSSFYSPSRGSAERLPNGNLLIAESDSGRLFEITADGRLVWEFLNDVRMDSGQADHIYRTKAYAPEAAGVLQGHPAP